MNDDNFLNITERVTRAVGDRYPFWVVLGRFYHGLSGGFLLFRNFSVAISVNVSCLFYLCLYFDFYVSKIMHL